MDDIKWITVRGNHIPIMKGESEEDALNRFFSNKEIKNTADEDDIDIEFETEDENIKYDTLYYAVKGGWNPATYLIDKDELDKYREMGYNIHEFDMTAEMSDKMNELFNKYGPENKLRFMVNDFSEWLKMNNDGLSYQERRLLVEKFRKSAIEKCKDYAKEFLNNLPKLEDNSTTKANEANVEGYAESRKASYGSKEYDWYTSNCQRCIIAYEMRRRGYNVEANKYNNRGDEIYNTDRSLTRAFLDYNEMHTKRYATQPNGEKYPSRGALIRSMANDMKSEGEGARFVLSWDWKNCRYGHTVNAEVTNGEVIIYDAQINKTYTAKDLIDRKDLRATTLTCTRVDNLTLSNRLEDLVKWKH